MIKSAIAMLLSFLSFQLAAQNVLQQTNNISADYYVNYQTTMNSVVGTLLNGSAASMKALAALSNNQLSVKYLQEQSKKFKANYRQLQDGGRPSLKSKNSGKDKWWVYTYFTTNSNSTVNYFLQLKVVFVEAKPVPVSRLKIGDDVPTPKIKNITVLDNKELSHPNAADVYEALKESDEFMQKASSEEFQQLMKEVLEKEKKKK